jgi:hypothetical protein
MKIIMLGLTTNQAPQFNSVLIEPNSMVLAATFGISFV